jgi:short-subunit dehydrogenase
MNKVVIITGASSGIGLACVKEFSKNGYSIVMAARSYDKLICIEKEIKIYNPNILSIKTDVSNHEDCRHLIESAIDRFGRIDMLINNAGISMRALFKDLDLSVLHTIMNTNFWGTVYCTKYALPYILEQKGSIVGITSIAGFMGLPGRTGYSASKFAMHGFLETLRVEHLHQGLHVMIVAPGFTASNIRKAALGADGMILGETSRNESLLMPAEEVARKIFKGSQKRKRLIILTLQGKLAVFLRNIIPRMIDSLDYYEMKREPKSPLI